MRKNGFTLIELLAVIVILAIIALIATPIILGIINDAREKANERSVELYASAVKNGIAAHQLRGNEVVAGVYTSSTLPFEVESDGDVVCNTIDIYEDGGVYVADCKVNDIEVDYTYGTKQEKVVYIGDVCNPVSVSEEGKYTAGDKYNCTVDPNKPAYTFYVLTSATSGSVNLIMDSNIRTGGEAVKEATPTDEQKGLVAWIAQTDYERDDIGGTAWSDATDRETFGPITAIEYLQEATSGWTNTNPQTISTFIDNKDGIHNMAKEYVVNARMPYYSEISNASRTTVYLIDYLEGKYDAGIPIVGRNGVSGVAGYWTLSSYADSPCGAWYVRFSSSLEPNNVGSTVTDLSEGGIGVRPVINLSI